MIYYIRMDKAYLPEYQDHLPEGLRDRFYFKDMKLHRYVVVYLSEMDSYHWFDNENYHPLS